MLPQALAHSLRAAAVRPSRAVRASARAFLALRHLPPERYGAVQLRANHLAHSAFEQTTAAAAAASSTAASSTAAASTAASSSCSQRVAACARRLGRAAKRRSLPATTVAASDVPTLFEANQDGESHRRKPYMRDCLLPALPSLRRWYASAGVSFSTNCSSAVQAARAQPLGHASALSSKAWGAAAACDAGFLGLVDLLLATEASSFVAVETRTPWRSAFLEWIVQARQAAGKSSELISC